MSIFKRKDQPQYSGAELSQDYFHAILPDDVEPGHADRSGYIIMGYSILDPQYLVSVFQRVKNAVLPLLKTTDLHSPGNTAAPHIDTIMPYIRAKHQSETEMHLLSGQKINSARQTRISELERQIPENDREMQALSQEIEPIRHIRARHAITLRGKRIALGWPATALFCVFDTLVNLSFVQSICIGHILLLFATLIGLALMSDGSMALLGTMMSQGEQENSKKSVRIFKAVLIGAFVLSVIGTVVMKIGSMSSVYGEIVAGELVAKESYNLAEWGLTILTSFVTGVTGVFSLILSIDPEAAIEKHRRELEAKLESEKLRTNFMRNELSRLKLTPDPLQRDAQCRVAADNVLNALPEALKLYTCRLQAEQQNDADYTDAMTEYAEELLARAWAGSPTADTDSDDMQSDEISNTCFSSNKLKEAV